MGGPLLPEFTAPRSLPYRKDPQQAHFDQIKVLQIIDNLGGKKKHQKILLLHHRKTPIPKMVLTADRQTEIPLSTCLRFPAPAAEVLELVPEYLRRSNTWVRASATSKNTGEGFPTCPMRKMSRMNQKQQKCTKLMKLKFSHSSN